MIAMSKCILINIRRYRRPYTEERFNTILRVEVKRANSAATSDRLDVNICRFSKNHPRIIINIYCVFFRECTRVLKFRNEKQITYINTFFIFIFFFCIFSPSVHHARSCEHATQNVTRNVTPSSIIINYILLCNCG